MGLLVSEILNFNILRRHQTNSPPQGNIFRSDGKWAKTSALKQFLTSIGFSPPEYASLAA